MSASLAAIFAAGLPLAAAAQDEVQAGGTLIVAADTEPANLNPAMVASNGVFFVSSEMRGAFSGWRQGSVMLRGRGSSGAHPLRTYSGWTSPRAIRS